MPHAHNMPSPGFQALILCGPGVSLNTFTSSPEEFPKALVPIANRPMIWYPLDWCYRLGITNAAIHLVTPPSSFAAIEAALSTDPHLTSLPIPRADILAPEDLTQNTGTAEILRLPEVQAVITGDFLVLPCDLICEVAGEAFLETWMIKEAGLGGITGSRDSFGRPTNGSLGEYDGRRGGLGVWFQTKGDDSVKGEETDFIATSSALPMTVAPPKGSLLPHISHLLYSISKASLKDITDEKKVFPIRHSLVRKHGHVKLLSSLRDAHIYFFPFWTLDLVKRNETFDSISEDLVGWWAKARWQDGLGDKLGFPDGFVKTRRTQNDDMTQQVPALEDEIDLSSMTTTGPTNGMTTRREQRVLASRIRESSGSDGGFFTKPTKKTVVPPILAYVHPSQSGGPIVRRADTGPLLLSVSLRLAKLKAINESAGQQLPSSPFAHKSKIANPAGIAQLCTVTKADCLLGDHVIVEEKSVIKESVVGANCHIKKGVRLTRCVLMDGVVVEDGCQLSGSILGKKSRIGKEVVLRDCEVQGGHLVSDGTEARNEKFMTFEGLENGDDDDDSSQMGTDAVGQSEGVELGA
ncbi:MAG: hypothetical protein M1816_005983 [Peltula sp. TS41687]|nr:MAG: hypothetical protein M1816_005983 [Peltula sp. TS41687]